MKIIDFVQYAFESGTCMAVMFGIYWLFMRKETYFQFNRIYLLSTVALSCLIPLGNFNINGLLNETSAVSILTSLGKAISIPEVTITEGSRNGFSIYSNWPQLVIWIYLLGASFLFFRIIIGIVKIDRMKKTGKTVYHDNYSVIYITQHFVPFSFFRTIFINENLIDHTEKSQIIDHEFIHIRQLHTYDNLIIGVFLVLFWFNPFMWLIKRSLRNTHEYLADNGIKKSRSNVENYQALLIKQIQGLSPLIVTNNFNSIIKNRIKMMYKRKSSVLAKFKPLLILPSILCLSLLFAFNERPDVIVAENQEQNSDSIKRQFIIDENSVPISYMGEKIYFDVDEFPKFQSKAFGTFREYIKENLRYPEQAKENNITGKVYVQFIVDYNGEVSHARVVRGVDPLLDKEAIRVTKSSPTWEPGKHEGKNVNVQFTFPVNFVQD